MPSKPINTVEEYIAQFDFSMQALLKEMQHKIRSFLPNAIEKISYQMPGYQYGNSKQETVWFAGYKQFVSLYLPPRGTFQHFAKELKPYKQSKSAVQFPIEKPIPYPLVKKLIRYQVDLYKKSH